MLDHEAQRRADRELEDAARLIAEELPRPLPPRSYAVPGGMSLHALQAMVRYGTRDRTLIVNGLKRTLGVRFEHGGPRGRPTTVTYPLGRIESWEDACRRLRIL